MASSSPRKANPIEPDLKALIKKAKDPKTSFKQLGKLQEHPEVEVRRALLDNPNVCPTNEDGKLTTDLLAALAQEFPEEVAVHPLFVLHALIEPDGEMLGVVVEVVGRTAEAGLIEQVLRSWGLDSWLVRRAVAWNPSTPIDLLRLLGNLATEPEGEVRFSVAKNPTTPVDVLRTLGNEITESEWYVRDAVARNLNTSVDVLRTLGNEATESEGYVRATAKSALAARGLT